MLNGLPTKQDLERIREVGGRKRTELPKTIFVAGPRIRQKEAFDAKMYTLFASALRHQLCEMLASEEFTVYAGENEELLDAAQALFKTANNSHLAEAFIAKEFAAAVIIIPDSPGSFAELGAWSGCTTIAPKMLVLVDKQYEGDLGYVITGPVKESARNNAKIYYYDQKNLDGVFDEVRKFADAKIISANVSGFK